MNNFELHLPTQLVFGRGEHKRIGELLAPYAKRVLIHYGSERIKENGLFDEISGSLKAFNIEHTSLGGVRPNPRVDLVREGIALAREYQPDLILAVGGGSAIDSAKAIAQGYYYDGDVWDLFERGIVMDKTLKIACVLTIPAAGSEMSANCIISNEETESKWGARNPLVKSVVSVVNPELFFTLPKNQIANGVSNMMSHIFERYFTQTTNVDLTNELCEGTLRAIMRNAPVLMDNPQDYDAWAEIGFCGSLAHNTLLGMGRDEDWATHRIEHEFSFYYDIAHGAGLSIFTPAWMKYVRGENHDMFMRFAQNVMGACDVDVAIEKLEEFYKSLSLPIRLSELGIGDEKFQKIASKPNIGGACVPLGSFKKLYKDDVLSILELAK